MSEFPKAKYQKGQEPRLVYTEQQEAALGGDWFDTPRLAGMVEDVGPENNVERHLKTEISEKDAHIEKLGAENVALLEKVEDLVNELETASAYVQELEEKVKNLEIELEKASAADKGGGEETAPAPANDKADKPADPATPAENAEKPKK